MSECNMAPSNHDPSSSSALSGYAGAAANSIRRASDPVTGANNRGAATLSQPQNATTATRNGQGVTRHRSGSYNGQQQQSYQVT